ncbi:MAG: hypothetical protein IJA69_04370 [Clostridia bacterium]|nr:hypothetical protein [Clostridia bacterium]
MAYSLRQIAGPRKYNKKSKIGEKKQPQENDKLEENQNKTTPKKAEEIIDKLFAEAQKNIELER